MAGQASALLGTRLPTLDRFDLLGLLGPELYDEVLRGATPINVPANSLLYRPGQGVMVLLVRDGLVRAFFASADGREATVAFGHSGELVGAVSALGDPPNLCLQAVTATSAQRLDTTRLLRMAADTPTVGMALARHSSHQLRKALHLVALRSLGSVRERVACDLLDRACRTQLSTGNLEVRVSHAQLADSVGSSREVVTRAIASLRSSGLVRTSRGVVTVSDPDELADIHSGFAV